MKPLFIEITDHHDTRILVNINQIIAVRQGEEFCNLMMTIGNYIQSKENYDCVCKMIEDAINFKE